MLHFELMRTCNARLNNETVSLRSRLRLLSFHLKFLQHNLNPSGSLVFC